MHNHIYKYCIRTEKEYHTKVKRLKSIYLPDITGNLLNLQQESYTRDDSIKLLFFINQSTHPDNLHRSY
jgi:hypothetical protein